MAVYKLWIQIYSNLLSCSHCFEEIKKIFNCFLFLSSNLIIVHMHNNLVECDCSGNVQSATLRMLSGKGVQKDASEDQ